MSRVIVITSGKGGVGKTTVCANLGLNLSKKKYRVCVVDMDIGLNNLDVVLGMENRVLYSMQDVLDGKCRLVQALIQDNTYSSLYLLSSGNLVHNLAIRPEYIKAVFNDLKATFDYILIDCPAGIDAGFNRAVICAEEAIVVTTPHLSSIRDADKVVTILTSYNLSSIKFVVNRARGDLIMDKLMLDVYEISRALKVEFGGVIPEDDNIIIGQISNSNRLNNKLPSQRAFAIFADNIETGSKKLYDCTYKYKGVVGSMRKFFKRKI
ncbi:MAG: septum site-determining protein MinD [Clostridia bacterium]|nr:septum site-determining protein MinD [Clostridia bacterium]